MFFTKWCRFFCCKTEPKSPDFMHTLETQHQKEAQTMLLQQKLLTEKLDYVESITIIV